jgi:hypothetical protein
MTQKSYIGKINCQYCNKEVTKRIEPKTKRHYCSVECKKSDKDSYPTTWTIERRQKYSKMMTGENNPNYGNKWSDEQKKQQSDRMSQKFKDNPLYAYECGKSNRGKKFSQDQIDGMHKHRSKESYCHPHSDEIKQKIGLKSKEKWTPEYKEKHRQTMEFLGKWEPLSTKNLYKIYYSNANWIGSMIEFFNDTDMNYFKEFGFFNCKTNLFGCVRDHIVPRKVGYEFNIPYQLLRHPANLQLLSNSNNIKKGYNDRKLSFNEKQHIINELYEKIANFNKDWHEHQLCLTLLESKEVV